MSTPGGKRRPRFRRERRRERRSTGRPQRRVLCLPEMTPLQCWVDVAVKAGWIVRCGCTRAAPLGARRLAAVEAVRQHQELLAPVAAWRRQRGRELSERGLDRREGQAEPQALGFERRRLTVERVRRIRRRCGPERRRSARPISRRARCWQPRGRRKRLRHACRLQAGRRPPCCALLEGHRCWHERGRDGWDTAWP